MTRRRRNLDRPERARLAPLRPTPARPVGPAVSLLIRPEVLHTITDAAAAAGRRETGGPLLGTVQRSWEPGPGRLIVSVLATIAPGPATDADLGWVTLGADGDQAATALSWWRSATGLELVHLGDWHKHVSGRPMPSTGDCDTAADMAAASPVPVWLTAVAVGTQEREDGLDPRGHVVTRSGYVAGCTQVGFYRAAPGGELLPVAAPVEAAALPMLPPLPWHVAEPARYTAECRLLHAAGYALAVDGSGPTLALRVQRPDEPEQTVLTGPDYPRTAPVVLRPDGRRDTPVWRADRFLVDALAEAA